MEIQGESDGVETAKASKFNIINLPAHVSGNEMKISGQDRGLTYTIL